MQDFSRKQVLVKRIVECVREYDSFFKCPAPYRLVSQRFSQVCRALGGLDLFLKELEVDGTLVVTLLPKGNKIVAIARGGRATLEVL